MGSTIVISRHGMGDARHTTFEDAVAAACRASGFPVFIVPPLYHLPDESAVWGELSALPGDPLLLSWLYPRPTACLLQRHGVQIPRLPILHLGAYDTPEACHAAVRASMQDAHPATVPGSVREIDDAVTARWYPVIDFARCENCHHCLQFCLFGVYELRNGQVRAVNPDRCKPGCPACSRICPQGAIIFPLYEREPAIAGVPGQYMTPDLAARKMFYTRTKQPCPHCGGTPENQPVGPSPNLCPECGRPLPAADMAKTAAEFDDIDALIDDLDRLAKDKR